MNRVKELEAENAQLKEEIDRLKRPTLEQVMNSILDRRPELTRWARYFDDQMIAYRKKHGVYPDAP